MSDRARLYALATHRAESLLCSRLSRGQVNDWKDRGQFEEYAHGRYFRFRRRHGVAAFLTVSDLRAQWPYSSGCHSSAWVKMGFVYTAALPVADRRLIALMMIRYQPEKAWWTVCVDDGHASSTKRFPPCVDSAHHHEPWEPAYDDYPDYADHYPASVPTSPVTDGGTRYQVRRTRTGNYTWVDIANEVIPK